MNTLPHRPGETVHTLRPEEINRFMEEGWAGPFPLLSAQEVESTVAAFTAAQSLFLPVDSMKSAKRKDAFETRPWFKSLHSVLPEFFDIVNRPELVGRVTSIIGDNALAWGVCVATRRPGDVHRWHVDVEHRRWQGISAFIGLTGITPKSTLKVITESHRLKESPQDLIIGSDTEALGEARRLRPSCNLVTPEISEGEFFLFDGLLWHGSANDTSVTRHAIIAQFCRPTEIVKIPLGWNEPISRHSSSPPCVIISGEDKSHVNRLVGRPTTLPKCTEINPLSSRPSGFRSFIRRVLGAIFAFVRR